MTQKYVAFYSFDCLPLSGPSNPWLCILLESFLTQPNPCFEVPSPVFETAKLHRSLSKLHMIVPRIR